MIAEYKAVALKPEHTSESLGELVKIQIDGPHPQNLIPYICMSQDPRICITNAFSDDAVASLGNTL